MEKKTAALLGAIAGFATLGAAHAATPPTPNATDALQAYSYADLLNPVDNASALLKASDFAHLQQPKPNAELQLVDDYSNGDRNYHHHHQAYQERGYNHHHQAYERQSYNHHHQAYNQRPQYHHHHQQGSYVGIPGVGGVEIGHH